ncbi:hypothetical protein D4R87_02675 [bacterium]|nr:MAG: hypothetical protein D4R87_02675 [bacterium]
MLKEVLQKIVDDKRAQGVPDFVIRNFLKEYLQYPVLDFIYNNPDYKNFIFTGGSCLRICFNAPRLSEDLDFDLIGDDYKRLDMHKLADSLQDYFKNKFIFDVESRVQADKRVYLKFPVLKELGLAGLSESDFLYVKVEPNKGNFENPEIELSPVSNYGYNFIVKNYSLKFLMTGKLNAFFTRKWFKVKENEIDIKGRDFYDLFWYFQNNISPDFENLKKSINISNEEELKKDLKKNINKNITAQKLSYDLKNFFPDQNFVNDFCNNYKEIIGKYL